MIYDNKKPAILRHQQIVSCQSKFPNRPSTSSYLPPFFFVDKIAANIRATAPPEYRVAHRVKESVCTKFAERANQ